MKHLLIVIIALLVIPQMTNASAQAGSLVKCEAFTAVYYLADDGKRYVFPNDRIYFSWYDDFSSVKEISCDDLGDLALGGNVPYQAGSRLLKILSVPTVYAIEDEGGLRAITSESQAQVLYGDDWASLVDDLPDAFFGPYNVGDELEDGELPQGMILEDEDDNYYKVGSDGVAVDFTFMLEDGFGLVTRNFVFEIDEVESRLGETIEIREFTDQEERDEFMMEFWPVCIDDEDVVDFDAILEVGETDDDEEVTVEEAEEEVIEETEEEEEESSIVTFSIIADETQFDPSSITVSAGDTVQITYTFIDENIYFGGLDIKSDYFDTISYRESNDVESATVEFVAEQSFSIKSYWPSSGVLKRTMNVVVE